MPSTVQKWMDFFLDSGIPDATAATYATNFANNRYDLGISFCHKKTGKNRSYFGN